MLKTERIDDVYVVSIEGSNRLNALISESVKEELVGFFNKPNTKLVMNLEGIEFIDSSGFAAFLSTLKTANNNYGTFKICNVTPSVMELFKMLQLHNVFEIYSNLNDCLKSIS
ncbi:MAG: STAS domain-containing protein [Bacteroidota bacterium]|nr:STAS domain-containing protein [Bacteroidota bacterium]MDP4226286.1 STAS domain-containing protein [Bacteroidota bacterium]MDP4273363.1 STAS domain-containing protein [Bacteroidota bacterium]